MVELDAAVEGRGARRLEPDGLSGDVGEARSDPAIRARR